MSWNPAKAGILNRVYAQAFTPAIYGEVTCLFRDAEALGLGGGWLAQHHFGGENGQLPAPLILLAHIAKTTRTLRLGTAVVVLPLERTLRLAEDAAVLDVLAGGRLELGLGAGFDSASFAAFDEDVTRASRLYEGKITRLIDAFAGAPVHAAGTATLNPPALGLRQRIWESRSEVELVARRGNGLLIAPRQPGKSDAASLIARYRAAWAEGAQNQAPRVALVRGVFPGLDAASVEAEVGADILSYVSTRLPPGASTPPLPELLGRLGVAWGSPAQIVDQLSAYGGLDGVNQLIAQVQTVSTDYATASRRLELFVTRVLPQLPAPAPTQNQAA